MAKLTIEVDVDTEKEAIAFVMSKSLLFTLQSIDEMCRSRMKHGENVSQKEWEILDSIRDECLIINQLIE